MYVDPPYIYTGRVDGPASRMKHTKSDFILINPDHYTVLMVMARYFLLGSHDLYVLT